ncbi:MAG: energy transducer TonB [Phaeodactylibacter sp.]|nr:energy transducer TonB [Phaeodactylibacter sp.]
MKKGFFIVLLLLIQGFIYAQDMAFSDYSISPSEGEHFRASEKKTIPLHLQVRNPGFTGGQKALDDYIHSNLEYPVQAEQQRLEGTVIVKFLLDKTGKVNHAVAENAIGMGCEEAAVRLVESMPAWMPAIQGGKAVPAKVRLPIRFRLY